MNYRLSTIKCFDVAAKCLAKKFKLRFQQFCVFR